jgi:hypothetical protein
MGVVCLIRVAGAAFRQGVNPMRTRRNATINDLRLAIECLPRGTKVAMLEGIEANDIIVGAYTDREGICPMLAAHRAGGRTSYVSFARAWDRFAFRDSRDTKARRATERELLILRTHLEASLLEEDAPAADLASAIAEHRGLVAAQPAVRKRPGDRDRSRELRKRPGWAWMRVMRRYDDYERALERLRAQADHGGAAGHSAERSDTQRETALR